ncbi:hypothetical protein PY254_00595 [Rhodanobacter sp. AS-Z3]|uniref:hypothetical protein n=1 Tax=Rhodanobacter sp. AS-Z3 TaxID=3031330 RepID=UPI0024786D5C|nr:hypothetical protein [Rhodanobacter sp. AS-Z3]WEN15213.1 hypothetical protein PY254_00595 [Rhodanobacter sp. AS-Z3]
MSNALPPLSPPARLPTQRRVLIVAAIISALIGAIALAVGSMAGYAWLVRLGWVAIATAAVWVVCAMARKPERLRSVQMRYIREFFPAMVGYMVLLPVSILLLKQVSMPLPLKAFVVLLPAFPILLVIRAMTRLLRGLDELQQRIQLQAMGLTCAIIGAGTFALGLLQGAQVVPVFRDQIVWVLPATFAVWGVVVAIISRRYRDE